MEFLGKLILNVKSYGYRPLARYTFEHTPRFLVHSAKIWKLLPFFLCKLLPLSGKEVINFSAPVSVLTMDFHQLLTPPRFFIDATNHPGTNRAGQSLARALRSLEPTDPPASPELAMAGRVHKVSRMNQLMVIDRLKAFGEPATASNKQAYFCTWRLSILPM